MHSAVNIYQIIPSNNTAIRNALTDLNYRTGQYGLVLTDKEIDKVVSARSKALRDNGRIEFGVGILPVIAEEICSSLFVNRKNYADVICYLVDVFFAVKTAVCDGIADRDLIRLMKDYYENREQLSYGEGRERDIELLVRYAEMETGKEKPGDIKRIMQENVYESEGYTDERL